MQNIIVQPQLVELIHSFFKNGYENRDYAKLWVDEIKPYFNNHPDVFQKGPHKSKAIPLGQDEKIHLWYAPAGNIPKNDPKLIIMGMATSKPALDYIMENTNLNSTEQQVRSTLIKSSFNGKMLGNLGVVFKYLNLTEALKSDLDLIEEWSNIGDAKLSFNLDPEGQLFENPLDSNIMFSQWCMHCGTELSPDTGKHNTSSVNMKKFVNLYERIFTFQNYQLFKDKFFSSNSPGMLIALGEKQYQKLREIYESKFPNVSWVDFESHILDKKTKFVTWIPHPSPGNPFFNRTVNKKGTMDSLNLMNEQLTIENSGDIINDACIDYKNHKRQACQIVFLKSYLNNVRIRC
ncbi:MAG: hypothetical protein GQ469_06530 [Methanosarcinales archaeon]|nr:hypothetical protein [Methanosarcinales archaeon]